MDNNNITQEKEQQEEKCDCCKPLQCNPPIFCAAGLLEKGLKGPFSSKSLPCGRPLVCASGLETRNKK